MPPIGRRRRERDEDASSQPSGPATRRRRLSNASESENAEANETLSDNKQGIPEADVNLMVKNLIRLALACEHTRTPVRREDISKRVFVHDHKRCFQLVFDRAQARLKATLGMQLVELPARDRTRGMTMTQQRKAAHTQASNAAASQSTSKPSKSWILMNLLPASMKQISQRQHMETERNYNAVVTILLVIVAMSDEQNCTESRAMSTLERLGWIPETPSGPFDEVIAKMTKQGYLDRVKDDSNTDGTYSLFLGPRGKLETLSNVDDLFAVVAAIYDVDDDVVENATSSGVGGGSGSGGGGGEETARARLRRVVEDTLRDDEDGRAGESMSDGDEEEGTALQ